MRKKELLEDLSTIGIGRRKLASRYTASPENVKQGVEVVVGENNPALRAIMYLNIHREYMVRLAPVSTRFIRNLDAVIERGYNPIIVFDIAESPTAIVTTLMNDIRERQVKRSEKMPMIVTSYPNSFLHVIEAPDRVLYKPYNMSELLETIREVEQSRVFSEPMGIEPVELSHWSPQVHLKQLTGS